MQFRQGVSDLEDFLSAWGRDMLQRGFTIETSKDAPSTYQELRALREFSPAKIIVYNGGCDNTIFSQSVYNHLFRAFHDFGHLSHGLDFQFKNEITLGERQANEVYDAVLPTIGLERANVVRQIIRAEIIGQIEYYQIHRRYIDDQKTYVIGYLGVEGGIK